MAVFQLLLKLNYLRCHFLDPMRAGYIWSLLQAINESRECFLDKYDYIVTFYTSVRLSHYVICWPVGCISHESSGN